MKLNTDFCFFCDIKFCLEVLFSTIVVFYKKNEITSPRVLFYLIDFNNFLFLVSCNFNALFW
ncbi:hypothetical protein DDT54_13015 [Brenneria nigrifluens DSM 30175 = ATCC 13028]|uniref:Uncharacterized protein n=1 Tax=Brenneria nigrifluens DSM 30175 = ATCC 13028 TaxID=1121120 RepID=A0A2U1UQ66_9GAMM|nr:hypothetical protein DDT54_13015 [Brenneria nigrifluens DSM 30175 = ATCC 13028]